MHIVILLSILLLLYAWLKYCLPMQRKTLKNSNESIKHLLVYLYLAMTRDDPD